MDIRLVAMDLDGTLLDGEKAVSEQNMRALRACEARGVHMVLASGRSFESMRLVAQGIGLKSPLISANGARVDQSSNGPILMTDYFEHALAEKVFDIVHASGVFFAIYGPGVMYQNNLNGYDDTERGLNRGMLRAGREFKSGGDIRLVRNLRLTIAEGLNQTLKFVLFNRDSARLAQLREAIGRETDCAMSSSDDESLEIMTPGGGKGRAVEFLMKHYVLKREQVMVFGDHTNDLTMFEAAGYPVAMGNAIDPVKRVAWHVAPANDQSGVGQILETHVLGENA